MGGFMKFLALIGIFGCMILPLPAQSPVFLEMGTIDYDEVTGVGTIEILMTSTVPIAAFQFDLVFDPAQVELTSAAGGLAGTFGYNIGFGATSGTVLGFSLTLVEIPETLTPMELVSVGFECLNCGSGPLQVCIEGVVISDVAANAIPTSVGPCEDISEGVIFRRGDCNADGLTNVADAIALLANLFSGAPLNDCLDGCDSNDDGLLNIADTIHLLLSLFGGGMPPSDPGPDFCGSDPTNDTLDCFNSPACP